MEIKNTFKRIPGLFQKYKYVALVLLIGIACMMIPSMSKTKTNNASLSIVESHEEDNLEQQLTVILQQTAGVGDARVLLTRGEGEETIYQTDTEKSSNETNNSVRANTVTITDSDRAQTGLIRQVNPATYLGAIVVCQGADDPQVRLSIVDAVSKATGLKANCISVLKMK